MTKEIQITRRRGTNYTPRSLMHEYAKRHDPEVQFHYGIGPQLIINGICYGYDRWDIVQASETTNLITIHLVDVL